MIATKMQTQPRTVPQVSSEPMRRFAGHLRDEDRRRAATALVVALRLGGYTSGKKAARALEVHESTFSRHADGQHDTPISRAREVIRTLTAKKAFPIAIIADLLADAWSANVAGKSLDELEAQKRELHRAEQAVDARVDIWQTDDLCGVNPECEDEVDAAILEQTTRLLELYRVRQEIREIKRRQG
jgi:hypothetical protein